jgi:uncharacterized caspase-like protein
VLLSTKNLQSCVADALCAQGFSVSIVLDPNLAAIDAALKAFRPEAETAELALIYLAGHAVERHDSGYFLAVAFGFRRPSLACATPPQA